MNVITEANLRARFSKSGEDTLVLGDRDYVTGSAWEYLRSHGVTVTRVSEDDTPEHGPGKGGVYADLSGRRYAEKPEHMTHLRGQLLVEKTHPRVALRGKLDSLQAKIIEVQLMLERDGQAADVVRELDEALAYVRGILAAEVKEIPFQKDGLFGYSMAELRAVSHDPQGAFGVAHLLPSHHMGAAVVMLNSLRALARETELAAAMAFPAEKGGTGQDLILALNRLSSAFYILMCRAHSGGKR